MSRYLINKAKGKYRVYAPIDPKTNDFVKEFSGQYSDSDLYLQGLKCQVYHYNHNILECWIDSIGRGNNIIKSLQENNIDIFDIVRTDAEVLFKFRIDSLDTIAPYLKLRTLGADISPWSSKNRPKKKYEISSEDLKPYEEIIASIPITERLMISRLTQAFFRTKYKSKKAYETHKQNIKTSGLKAKEYIHSIGLWQDYIKYLNKEINK